MFPPNPQHQAIPRANRVIRRWAECDFAGEIQFQQRFFRRPAGKFRRFVLPAHVKLDPMKADPALLQAALVGYESQLTRINQAIAEIRQKLGQKEETVEAPAKRRRRKKMSRSARQRIAAAQKKRWAEYKKSKGGT